MEGVQVWCIVVSNRLSWQILVFWILHISKQKSFPMVRLCPSEERKKYTFQLAEFPIPFYKDSVMCQVSLKHTAFTHGKMKPLQRRQIMFAQRIMTALQCS